MEKWNVCAGYVIVDKGRSEAWSALCGKHFPCYLTSRGTRAGIFAYLMALLPVIDLACCNVMPCEHQVLFYFKTKKKISFVHIDLFSEFLSSNFDYFFSLLETYITLFFNKIRVGLRLRTVHICIFGYTLKGRLFLVVECSSTWFIFWSNALMTNLSAPFKPPIFWLKYVSVCPVGSHIES